MDALRALYPEIPLTVVSEFPPPQECRWIPYHVERSLADNLALCRASLRDREVRLSAVILQPKMPYWRMRAVAFLLAPFHFLAFNENLGHFMLRPGSAGTICRHLLWRARNFVRWELSPGRATYTFLWRLGHPRAFRRPIFAIAARLAGWVGWIVKHFPARATAREDTASEVLAGVSVVIPSRDGRELLARGLPEVVQQIEKQGGEVIVSDNGSTDGTAAWLGSAYPAVVVVTNSAPLSFARAVNAGIAVARFSQVCLLNNDMVVEPGFFEALADAFLKLPDLFCATAQIFFPDGVRREETGKAVMPMPPGRIKTDFPVTCNLPIAGEDLSYVLYGSGGCSLYDTRKLRQLGALDPIYEPAYVEDLDLGFRGWQRAWPTVFVSGARVLHEHRATTSRHYTPEQLDRILELNYLRFVARCVSEPGAYRRLWKEAVDRLNRLAAQPKPNGAAIWALSQAWSVPAKRPKRAALSEEAVLALGSGDLAVFPGVQPRGKPVVMIITPYIPFPLAHGGAVRMYNLMRRAAANFDLVLVSFVDDLVPVPREIHDICIEIVTVKRFGSHLRRSSARPDMVEEFDSPAFHAALRQTVKKWKPAIAQLEFTHMAQYAKDCAPAQTLLVEHDVTLDLHQQLLAQGEDWELRYQLNRWIPFEQAAWREVDRVVAMSEKDRTLIQGGRAVVLPNGVDIERFTPGKEEPEPGRVLFIGSFGHLPNVLAIEYFLREVWPGLAGSGAVLHVIAGARWEYFLDHYRDRVRLNLDQPGIEVDGFVSDVRPAYRRASVVVAPLLASAGTNIKIMEAMAMGRAVVSTPGGVNGLDLAAGKDVVVTPKPEEMISAIQELLADPDRRRALERQGRKTVVERFSWDAIARKQEEIYRSLQSSPVY